MAVTTILLPRRHARSDIGEPITLAQVARP